MTNGGAPIGARREAAFQRQVITSLGAGAR
jgi:hypothetical protein